MDAVTAALSVVLTGQHLLWVLIGVALGLLLGVIPGLGGLVGMTILLPLLFGMDPYLGLALLIGMSAITNTSDTFPAVLLGIPGSAGSQATVMDGYPLARQGKAGVALGAGFFVSMLGGLIGAVILLGSIFAIRPLVLAMGTPELFMLTLLGLSMVGVLSRGAPIAGLLAGLMGLALGAVGGAPATAVYRFTFDTVYLIDGIPLVALALALFALPEFIDLLVEDRQIAKGTGTLKGSRLEGIRQALRHKRLIIQSSVIGNMVGVIPGLGGAVVDWLAYGVAQQTSKNTQNFGKGDIRGVIAPESANNSKEAGALVPTLLFGIPGSPSTAVLLGGLMLLGVFAGPDMVTTQLPLTLSIIWTLAIANVIATLACLGLTKQIAKISYIKSKTLVPFLIVLITMAAYQATQHMGDILLFLGLGLVAWVMKRVKWPRAPLLVGFVLADPTERYLFRSIARYDYEWVTSPGVIAIGIVIVAIIFVGVRRQAVTPVQIS